MTPAELLTHLRGLGLRVAAKPDGGLNVAGKAGLLTPELAEAVRAHKEALLDLLWFEVPFVDAPWLRRWGEEYDQKPEKKEEEEQTP